ncbi:MAG: hypothetical protein ABI306_01945 [Caulobacteraceae bacterium]
MAIFAIISQPSPNGEKLAGAIKAAFDDAVYDVGNGVWLVSGRGPAREISDRIGITNGENGSGIILELASYFGRANPAIWTWIQANWETSAVD